MDTLDRKRIKLLAPQEGLTGLTVSSLVFSNSKSVPAVNTVRNQNQEDTPTSTTTVRRQANGGDLP